MRVYSIILSVLLSIASAAAVAQTRDLPQEVVINGVELLLVPGGWFWYTVERGRAHEVPRGEPLTRDVRIWLDSYYIAKHPARARDLQRFLGSGDSRYAAEYEGDKACAVRIDRRGDFYLVDPERDMSATHISWKLADEFSRWMGLRLPTEAEWQKAARGTDRRNWPWGDEYPDDTYAGFLAGIECNPAPVDSFPKGVSPYGAYNMAGNVFEWVADWYNEEFDASLKDGMRNPRLASRGTTKADLFDPVKILKGGRWASAPGMITVYSRHIDLPKVGFVCYGTRFAADVTTVRTHLAKGTAKVVRP